MSSWKKVAAGWVAGVEGKVDQYKQRFARRYKLDAPLMILPYNGYATATTLYLRGRVRVNKEIGLAADDDTMWDNLLNTIKRISSEELPGATVTAKIGPKQGTAAQELTVQSDEEGFFTIEMPLLQPLSGGLWHEVELYLTAVPTGELAEPVTAVGHVLAPPADARFGVISDIDDTVMFSSATNILRAVQLMFLGNAHTRLPFSGVATFYRGLQMEAETPVNPIFYVSSSPWNLYDFLTHFFELQQVPRGPLFLLDYGFTPDHLLMASHHDHKVAQIEQVLQTYNELPFLLIGDSGQKDPEIYAEIVKRYPGRIEAVYIRDVTNDKRDAEVLAVAEAVSAAGVEMLLVPDSLAAAEHAHARGWLNDDQLAAVAVDKARSEAEKSELEQLLDDEG